MKLKMTWLTLVLVVIISVVCVCAPLIRKTVDCYLVHPKTATPLTALKNKTSVPNKEMRAFPRWFDERVLGKKPTVKKATVAVNSLPAPVVSIRQSRFNGKNMDGYEIRMEMMSKNEVVIRNSPPPDFLVLNVSTNCEKLFFLQDGIGIAEQVADLSKETMEATDTIEEGINGKIYWCQDRNGLLGENLTVLFRPISAENSIDYSKKM